MYLLHALQDKSTQMMVHTVSIAKISQEHKILIQYVLQTLVNHTSMLRLTELVEHASLVITDQTQEVTTVMTTSLQLVIRDKFFQQMEEIALHVIGSLSHKIARLSVPLTIAEWTRSLINTDLVWPVHQVQDLTQDKENVC
jgi:hypothetical protein